MEFQNKQYEPMTMLEAKEAEAVFGESSECQIEYVGRVAIPLREFSEPKLNEIKNILSIVNDDKENLELAKLEGELKSYWSDKLIDSELFIEVIGQYESYKYADLQIKNIDVQMIGTDSTHMYINVVIEDHLISTTNIAAHLQ